MKGIAKGSLLDMLKNALRKVKKRNLEPAPTDRVEYTIENLIALLIEKGYDEEHIKQLQRIKEEYDKVNPADENMSTEELADFLKKKKEYTELLEDIERIYKPLTILKEKESLEQEHNECVTKLAQAVKDLEEAINSGDLRKMDSSFKDIKNLFITINKDQKSLGLKAEEFKTMTGEEFTTNLTSLDLSPEKARELVRISIRRMVLAEEYRYEIEDILVDFLHIFLPDMVDKTTDLKKIEEEENEKVRKIHNAMNDILEAILTLHAIPPSEYSSLVDKYEELQGMIADFITLTKGSDLVTVPTALNDDEFKVLSAETGNAFVSETKLTPEQKKSIRNAKPELLGDLPTEEDKKLKAAETRDETTVSNIKTAVQELHKTAVDDPDLETRYTKVMELIARLIRDNMEYNLYDIDTDREKNRIKIVKVSDGTVEIDSEILTPEQKTALAKPKHSPEAPSETDADVWRKVEELRNDIYAIRSMDPSDPRLIPAFDAFEKKYDEVSKLGEKHKLFTIEIHESTKRLVIKNSFNGVTVLDEVILTEEQYEALVASFRRESGKPVEGDPDPAKEKLEAAKKKVDKIQAAIDEFHKIGPDDPSLLARKTLLETDITMFVFDPDVKSLFDISTGISFEKLVVKVKSDGTEIINEEILTPEQKAALAKPVTPPHTDSDDDEEKRRAAEAARLKEEEDRRKAEEARKKAEADRKKKDPDAMKADKETYLNCINELNANIIQINANNERLASMNTYNPEFMEEEINLEKKTAELERFVVDYQLELSKLRMEYYKKYGQFLLSDPEVLAAKQETMLFKSSTDLDLFVEDRNKKVINAEFEIIDLSKEIEELIDRKDTGYEVKVAEKENRIKLLQAYIRTQNSIIQRRIVAEGKSIDVSVFYRTRNEHLKDLRAEMKKEAPKPVRTETDDKKEELIIEKDLEVQYTEMMNDLVIRILKGEIDVILDLPMILNPALVKYNEVNARVHSEKARIFASIVREEQLDAILHVNQQLAAFYRKTQVDKRIPTAEEVDAFIAGIDKKGLNCSIIYDLAKNEFTFTYTHKEVNMKTTAIEEATRTISSIRIYDRELEKDKPKEETTEMFVAKVLYDRRELKFSPEEEVQKVDKRVAMLIANLSKIEVTKIQNKIKILYTEDLKNQLKDLKANIQLLNKKSKGKYDVTIGETPNENGKYASETVVRGDPTKGNYSLSIDIDVDGERKNIELDLEEKTRRM